MMTVACNSFRQIPTSKSNCSQITWWGESSKLNIKMMDDTYIICSLHKVHKHIIQWRYILCLCVNLYFPSPKLLKVQRWNFILGLYTKSGHDEFIFDNYDVLGLAQCKFLGTCQRFGETYCLHRERWGFHGSKDDDDDDDDDDDRDSVFLRNVGTYTAPVPRTLLNLIFVRIL
jgi:hypothetical protein